MGMSVAAYAQDTGGGTDNASERQTFRDFVGQVCRLDADKALPALVWQVFPGPVRVLLGNQYLFQPFWDALNHPHSDGRIPQHWREAFDDARQRVQRALAQQDTERVLYEVVCAPVHAAQPADARRRHLEQLGQPRPAARWPRPAGARAAGAAGRDDEPPRAVRGKAVLPGGDGLKY